MLGINMANMAWRGKGALDNRGEKNSESLTGWLAIRVSKENASYSLERQTNPLVVDRTGHETLLLCAFVKFWLCEPKLF